MCREFGSIGRVPEAHKSAGMQGAVYIRRSTAFVVTAIVSHMWSRSQEQQD